MLANNSFTDADTVAKLGVGKNMVASIRFWLRAFGLTKSDILDPISTYILDTEKGKDPFTEDINTIWLLHFLLVTSEIASLYNLLFVGYQREKKEFTKSELQSFIKRKCSVPEQKNVYNENTVRKDIGVLLKNYVAPSDLKTIEDFSALMIGLGLIINKGNDTYCFKVSNQKDIAPEIILFALIRMRGTDKTVSFDVLQKLSLIFGLPIVALIEVIRSLEKIFPGALVFSDNSGIKNVQFIGEIDEFEALNHYYVQL